MSRQSAALLLVLLAVLAAGPPVAAEGAGVKRAGTRLRSARVHGLTGVPQEEREQRHRRGARVLLVGRRLLDGEVAPYKGYSKNMFASPAPVPLPDFGAFSDSIEEKEEEEEEKEEEEAEAEQAEEEDQGAIAAPDFGRR